MEVFQTGVRDGLFPSLARKGGGAIAAREDLVGVDAAHGGKLADDVQDSACQNQATALVVLRLVNHGKSAL